MRSVEALEIIVKLMYNCAVSPREDKFRRVKLSNKAIASKLAAAPGAVEALAALGWVEDAAAPGELVVPAGTYFSMKEVRATHTSTLWCSRCVAAGARSHQAAPGLSPRPSRLTRAPSPCRCCCRCCMLLPTPPQVRIVEAAKERLTKDLRSNSSKNLAGMVSVQA